MAWFDDKSTGGLISSQMWDDMADTLVSVSGSYYNHSSNRDAHYPSSNITGWLDNVYISTTASVNKLNDVDTVSDTPARDEVLKWNGTNWVPATYSTTFEFSIASFSDGETTASKLIGVGEWNVIGGLSFAATYSNGPPDNSCVQMAENDNTFDTVVKTLTTPFTAGTNTVAVDYPVAKDQYITFRLSSNVDTDTDTDEDGDIYFRNYIRYGLLGKNSGFSASEISGLTSKTISNDHTRSVSLNAGSSEYLIFAFPATYTDLPSGTTYIGVSGGTGFRFNGMTCAFQPKEIVSITNNAGYTENYEAYGSTLGNLGNSTLTTYTSRQELNEIYYGVTTTASGYNEADVEGLTNSPITDDSTQTWSEVTAGAGEYLLFCFPKRWGEKGTDYSFYDNGTGLEAAFETPETVSITNSQGWTENFYVYRSENANLGAITIRTS